MWFIVCLIYMNTAAAPEIVVYKTTYNTQSQCHSVSQAYPSPLIDHLARKRPQAKRLSLRCVDVEQLLQLKASNRILSL